MRASGPTRRERLRAAPLPVLAAIAAFPSVPALPSDPPPATASVPGPAVTAPPPFDSPVLVLTASPPTSGPVTPTLPASGQPPPSRKVRDRPATVGSTAPSRRSRPPTLVRVPDLITKTVTAAAGALAPLDLALGLPADTDVAAAGGRGIVGQRPAAGTRVRPGSTVSVTLMPAESPSGTSGEWTPGDWAPAGLAGALAAGAGVVIGIRRRRSPRSTAELRAHLDPCPITRLQVDARHAPLPDIHVNVVRYLHPRTRTEIRPP